MVRQSTNKASLKKCFKSLLRRHKPQKEKQTFLLCLEGNEPDHLPALFGVQKHLGAVAAGLCVQYADAKGLTALVALVL